MSRRGIRFVHWAALVLLAASPSAAEEAKPAMSFFVTSHGTGKGADLGGLAGADALCQKLGASAGAGSRTWRAYLSTSAADSKPA
ncbi:MAG TPA: lectin, partial [Candidatus Binatia bacterium]